MSTFIEQIRTRAAAKRRRVVFPEGTDERTIRAAATLQQKALVEPILLGPIDHIRRALEQAGADADRIAVFDPGKDERRDEFNRVLYDLRKHKGMTLAEADERVTDALIFGALLVRTGEADASVAGAVRTTGDVMRAAFWCIGPAQGIKTVSSAFYMVVPPFRGTADAEVLTFTDAAVVPYPDATQLADIAVAATEARRRIVGDEPRVAFLSFSTKGSAEGPSIDTVRQAFALYRERMPDVAADGELQLDAAVIASVAERKAPGSPVGGQANVLVFPSLDAANIAYKAVQRFAKAEAIGPIVQGLTRPCNDLSRGASDEDIVNTACIAALLAEA